METVSESWRPVLRFANYEASNHGNVRSVTRMEVVNRLSKTFVRTRKGRVMKQILHRTGYLVINVSMDGTPTLVGVHQLIADAFHGPANGLTVNHINGNKHDNRPENLEYMTNRENMLHGYREGLIKNHGEHNHAAKLNDGIVRQMRSLKGAMSTREIARKFGATKDQVWRVLSRRSWSHVT